MIDYEYIGALKREIEKMTPEELLKSKHEHEAELIECWREHAYHSEQVDKYWKCIEREKYLMELIKHNMFNKEAEK